jgi:hypothetical protein
MQGGSVAKSRYLLAFASSISNGAVQQNPNQLLLATGEEKRVVAHIQGNKGR